MVHWTNNGVIIVSYTSNVINSSQIGEHCIKPGPECTDFTPYCFYYNVADARPLLQVNGDCEARYHRCKHPEDDELSADECGRKLNDAIPAHKCDFNVTCYRDLAPHCYEIASNEIVVVRGDCDNKRYHCRYPDLKEKLPFTQECSKKTIEANIKEKVRKIR
ncbi:hypothetical protein Trydic_g14295 [Trypoxylus dichotomus]